MEKSTQAIKRGDVVWAKVKGYPWWPGQIKNITSKDNSLEIEESSNNLIYKVSFIGDDTFARLPISKVKPFKEYLDEFKNKKLKKLTKPIDKAIKLYEARNNYKLLLKEDKQSNGINSNIVIENNSKDKENNKDKENKNNIKNNLISNDNIITNNSNPQKLLGKKINRTNNSNVNYIYRSSFDSSTTLENLKNKTDNKINNINKENSNKESTNSISNDALPNNQNNDIIKNEADQQEDELLKQLTLKILKSQVELSSSNKNKYLLSYLDSLFDMIKKIKITNLYEITKDLIPLLNSFIFNKNNEILVKSSEIILILRDKILNEIFDIYSDQSMFLPSKINNDSISSINLNNKSNLYKEIEDYLNKKKQKNQSTNFTKLSQNLNNSKPNNEKQDKLNNNNKGQTNRKESFNNLESRNKNTKGDNPSIIIHNNGNYSNINKIDKDKTEKRSSNTPDNSDIQKHNKSRIEKTNEIYTSSNNINDDYYYYYYSNKQKENRSKYSYKKQNLNSNNYDTAKKNINNEQSNNTEIKTKETNNDSNSNDNNEQSQIANDNSNLIIDNEQFKSLNDDIIKIITENDENAINDIYKKSEEFYKITYSKYNNLDIDSSFKRKCVCMKMLSLLSKIMKNEDINNLKKIIIFYEYNVRIEDPTLGEKYFYNINNIYRQMKQILISNK